MNISKRRFLKAGAAASVWPMWRRAAAADAYDVVVAGAGTAGMALAIFAAKRGGRVLLLEKADIIGGTLPFSGGQIAAAGTVFQKAKGIVDTPEQHYADTMRISANTANPAVTRLFVDNAGATVNWLADNGYTLRDRKSTRLNSSH